MIIQIEDRLIEYPASYAEKWTVQPNQQIVLGDFEQIYFRSDLPLSIDCKLPTGSVDVFHHRKVWLSSMFILNNIRQLTVTNTRSVPIGVVLLR